MKRPSRWITVGVIVAAVGLGLIPPTIATEPPRAVFVVELETRDLLVNDVVADAGLAKTEVLYRYGTVLNGFAARLTLDEAARVRATPGVRAVAADQVVASSAAYRRRPPTGDDDGVPGNASPAAAAIDDAARKEAVEEDAATRASIAATGVDLRGDVPPLVGVPQGIWSELGGPEHAGENLVIGVIDDGIVTNHPSFADQPVTNGKRNYVGAPFAPLPGWHGACQAGPRFPAGSCNNKVIGARYFVDGLGRENVDTAGDPLSPLSIDGHGVAVSGVAAGNYGVDPVVLGNDLGVGQISGMAPRARIASYKALWRDKRLGSGFGTTVDVLAALDAAVSDGVDIVNMSFGTLMLDTSIPGENIGDLFSRATLAAYEAGVILVASLGNEGPAAFTAGTPGATPWVVGAGASTIARAFMSELTFAAGGTQPVRVLGEGLVPGLPPTRVVVGEDIPSAGTSKSDAHDCHAGTIDASRAAGKVLLCGANGYLDEVTSEARRVGAAGLVLGYFEPSQIHGFRELSPPSVVVDEVSRDRLIAYARLHPAATITFGPAHSVSTMDTARRVSLFSSRGPGLARDFIDPATQSGAMRGAYEFSKPDVLAPGEGILTAAVPGTGIEGCGGCAPAESYTTATGTSFASPITAGGAALVKQARPDLSAAQIQSALALSATPGTILRVSAVPANPAQEGNGRLNPTAAADVGLVVTDTVQRYRQYLSTNVQRSGSGAPLDPHDLNRPSVAIDPFNGAATVTRTVTSVSDKPETWNLSVGELDFMKIDVSPASFTLQPGQQRTLTITARPNGAVENDFVASGVVLLTNASDGRILRMPVSGVPGAADLDIRPVVSAAATGTAVATLTTNRVASPQVELSGVAAPVTVRDQQILPGQVRVFDVDVPPGTALLEAAISRIDGGGYYETIVDLDLYILRDDNHNGFDFDDIVDASARALGAPESTGMLNPPAGRYRLLVDGFYLSDQAATFDMTHWVVPRAAGV
ncbi:MAG: hypothetical protein QOI61_2450, partial [Actinomycetota bacterium]